MSLLITLINGWVRESLSSYSSPIVVVSKKDGSMRMCADYRALNQKTVSDAQPMLRTAGFDSVAHIATMAESMGPLKSHPNLGKFFLQT